MILLLLISKTLSKIVLKSAVAQTNGRELLVKFEIETPIVCWGILTPQQQQFLNNISLANSFTTGSSTDVTSFLRQSYPQTFNLQNLNLPLAKIAEDLSTLLFFGKLGNSNSLNENQAKYMHFSFNDANNLNSLLPMLRFVYCEDSGKDNSSVKNILANSRMGTEKISSLTASNLLKTSDYLAFQICDENIFILFILLILFTTLVSISVIAVGISEKGLKHYKDFVKRELEDPDIEVSDLSVISQF